MKNRLRFQQPHPQQTRCVLLHSVTMPSHKCARAFFLSSNRHVLIRIHEYAHSCCPVCRLGWNTCSQTPAGRERPAGFVAAVSGEMASSANVRETLNHLCVRLTVYFPLRLRLFPASLFRTLTRALPFAFCLIPLQYSLACRYACHMKCVTRVSAGKCGGLDTPLFVFIATVLLLFMFHLVSQAFFTFHHIRRVYS